MKKVFILYVALVLLYSRYFTIEIVFQTGFVNILQLYRRSVAGGRNGSRTQIGSLVVKQGREKLHPRHTLEIHCRLNLIKRI